MDISKLIFSILCGTLIGCGSTKPSAMRTAVPTDAFLAALSPYCGQAFTGKITANEPAAPDDAFVGKTLTMHVRDCSAKQFKVPFHVGEDRSRTWELTAIGEQLQLKHAHRHANGELDELTDYGGITTKKSTANRAEFPVDAASKALFDRTGRQVSMRNIWALEITQDQQFVYALTRPGRVFRVAFDLRKPLEAPKL